VPHLCSRAVAGCVLEAPLARGAERLLEELRPKLAVVDIEAPDGAVTIADSENVAVPAKIFVEPGTHAVKLRRKNGSESVKGVSAPAGATSRVVFTAPVPVATLKTETPKRVTPN